VSQFFVCAVVILRVDNARASAFGVPWSTRTKTSGGRLEARRLSAADSSTVVTCSAVMSNCSMTSSDAQIFGVLSRYPVVSRRSFGRALAIRPTLNDPSVMAHAAVARNVTLRCRLVEKSTSPPNTTFEDREVYTYK
jgi:hypothetical protein